MKVIVTLAIYRNASEVVVSPIADGYVRHYCVEFSDYCCMLDQPVPQFAIDSAISYAYDEYYHEEGWKDVLIQYINHRIINSSTSSVVVTPCDGSGKKFPFFLPRTFNINSSDRDSKNKKYR